MLCEWKQCVFGELNVQDYHIHLLVSVPPKLSISKLKGALKGKIAIKLFKSYPNLKQKPYWGNHFWAIGYFVSKVVLYEDTLRKYAEYQEKERKRVEENQQKFDFLLVPPIVLAKATF